VNVGVEVLVGVEVDVTVGLRGLVDVVVTGGFRVGAGEGVLDG